MLVLVGLQCVACSFHETHLNGVPREGFGGSLGSQLIQDEQRPDNSALEPKPDCSNLYRTLHNPSVRSLPQELTCTVPLNLNLIVLPLPLRPNPAQGKPKPRTLFLQT